MVVILSALGCFFSANTKTVGAITANTNAKIKNKNVFIKSPLASYIICLNDKFSQSKKGDFEFFNFFQKKVAEKILTYMVLVVS